VTGQLTVGDEDWFLLPTVPGGAVLARTAGFGCTVDTILELVDGAGTVLESNDDADPNRCSDLPGLVRLPSAAVYLKVRAYDPTKTGVYVLGYMTSASSCAVDADGDDERACAHLLPVSSTATGGLPAGDEDWYRFTVGTATTRNVQLTTSTANCADRATSDTLLDLYNSANQAIASNDDILSGSSNYCSQLTQSVIGYGWFFAQVRPYAGFAVPSYTLARGSQ
jgi:hypothetical protein